MYALLNSSCPPGRAARLVCIHGHRCCAAGMARKRRLDLIYSTPYTHTLYA